MRSQSVTGRCVCPNCGYEDAIENLIDGCDYCHTKFHIQDFDGKVSSIYMPNDNKRSRGNNPFKKFNTVLYSRVRNEPNASLLAFGDCARV